MGTGDYRFRIGELIVFDQGVDLATQSDVVSTCFVKKRGPGSLIELARFEEDLLGLIPKFRYLRHIGYPYL